ncbi:hypothetical protein LTR04_002671 [Oleoguttula sp. CCFEE 6159]|nr:hypothetical protein LTR04_002671 [Oleoguttula sp. CCFEE 6159]
MRTLNRQRASLVFSHLIEDDEILTPEEVSKKERIFDWDGVVRWKGDQVIGHVNIGVKLQELLQCLEPARHGKANSTQLHVVHMTELLDIHGDEDYVLWMNHLTKRACVVLKQGCTPRSQLKAWACAIGMLHDASSLIVDREKTLGQVLQQTLDEDRPTAIVQLLAFLEITDQKFDGWISRLKQAGWDLDVAALETHSGSRLARDEISA